MSRETLYEFFGFTGENILPQKQVTEDIYKILKPLVWDLQTPNCISISTKNDWHQIYYYPFNLDECWGCYEYRLYDLKIPVNYKFKDLKKYIHKKFRETVAKSEVQND